MCIVSIYKKDSKIVITSNRDEDIERKTIGPKIYEIESKKFIFPKDQVAHGTWIIAQENNTVLVLLNGAQTNHDKKSNYKKSRGLILLEIAKAENPISKWLKIDLKDIEPFTIVLFINNEFFELIWDGQIKLKTRINEPNLKIWASSTLYSINDHNYITNKYQDIDESNAEIEDLILDFHFKNQYKSNSNHKKSIITKSTAQICINSNFINYRYFDLITNEMININNFK